MRAASACSGACACVRGPNTPSIVTRWPVPGAENPNVQESAQPRIVWQSGLSADVVAAAVLPEVTVVETVAQAAAAAWVIGLVLRCLGVRITVSGGPIRNLRGVLVVSGHISWVDIFTIGAVMPGSFVAKAEVISWPGFGVLARLMKVIPIERDSLRRLPAVVDAVAARLRAGHTVVAFPEGTTWCGLGYGPFRPAMFQAAIDAARPVQPLRLTYRPRDGSTSTVPAYIGEDTLWASICRMVTARRTVVHVHVDSLQLPGADRRELAQRCQVAVRDAQPADRTPGHALVA